MNIACEEYCTSRHSCTEKRGVCSKYVDRRKVRAKLVECGLVTPNTERNPDDEDGGTN